MGRGYGTCLGVGPAKARLDREIGNACINSKAARVHGYWAGEILLEQLGTEGKKVYTVATVPIARQPCPITGPGRTLLPPLPKHDVLKQVVSRFDRSADMVQASKTSLARVVSGDGGALKWAENHVHGRRWSRAAPPRATSLAITAYVPNVVRMVHYASVISRASWVTNYYTIHLLSISILRART